jgi:predicted TIM-barrel fold metal-dependent hydrolase
MTKYICIDADSHIAEPRDTFTSRVPAKYKEDCPVVRKNEMGKDAWFLGGQQFASVGSLATAGYAKPYPDYPDTYEDALKSSYDGKARIAYMDSVGIWAQVLYPNVGGFAANQFLKLKDDALRLACVQAYNDFLHDWTSVAPHRFVTNVAVPFWDVKASVKEIERSIKRGARGINFTAAPHDYGMPFINSHHWDPIWDIACESGLPINFHIGTGSIDTDVMMARMKTEGPGATLARASVDAFLLNAVQLNDLLFSGVLPRYPKIKFVSVESGIGWIPFVLEAADHQFHCNGVGKEMPQYKMLPSEYFRQHVYACYWFEKDAPASVVEVVGEKNILFETDFPHPTCLYGNVAETIERGLGHMKPQLRERILFKNAMDLYNIAAPPAVN